MSTDVPSRQSWCGYEPIAAPGRFGAEARRARVVTAGLVYLALLLAVGTPSATAEPDEQPAPVNPRDAVFIQDLNQIGIPYPSAPFAIGVARHVCAEIADGHSIRETVDEVRASNGAMSVLQGAHFVWVARSVYCPGHRSAL